MPSRKGPFVEYSSTDVTIIDSADYTDLAFNDANPDTLTSALAQFVVDAVLVGPIVVTATDSNNANFNAVTVVAGTITLDADNAVVAEAAGNGTISWGTAEEALVAKACSGVKAGQGLVIQGVLAITVAQGTTEVTIRVREGPGAAGTLVGEAIVDVTGMSGIHTRSMSIILVANAFQDDPVYQLTVQQTKAATVIGTVTSSAIIIQEAG